MWFVKKKIKENNDSFYTTSIDINTEGIYYYIFFAMKTPNTLLLKNSTNALRDQISEIYPNEKIVASHHYYGNS